jgi:phospholipase/carboxylesterase
VANGWTSTPGPEPAAVDPAQAAGEDIAAGVPFVELPLGGAKLTDALPMIIALHGRGGGPDNVHGWFTAFSGVQARLIIPHGHSGDRGGYNWFDERLQRDDEQTFAAGVARAEARVAGFIRELMKSRPTLGRPIVMGFSQGGILTFTLAAHDPDLVGEAIPVSGLLPRPLTPTTWSPQSPHPPIHASHGDEDTTFAKGRESVARLKALGLDCTMHEVPGVAHQIRPQLDYVYTELAQAARAQAALGVVHVASQHGAAAPPHADTR